jgi:hypothetical protein
MTSLSSRCLIAAWAHTICVVVGFTNIREVHAYTYEGIATKGCHEALTSDALAEVRRTFVLPTPTLRSEDAALARDLPFTLRDADRDSEAIALLIGVRDNDLRGRNGNDIGDLAEVHGSANEQGAHCLRTNGDTGEEGALRALKACRDFIRTEAALAIADLDEVSQSKQREPFLVALMVRGRVRVPLANAYVHLGRALHALQDSFTHTYRTTNGLEVTTVLTFLATLGSDYDEARDGPGHLAFADRCQNEDTRVQARYWQAREASRDLIAAVLQPGTGDTRSRSMNTVLDTWLRAKAGCSLANRYCDSPDAELAEEQGGCHVDPSLAGNGSPSRRNGALAAFVALGALGLQYARKKRSGQ